VKKTCTFCGLSTKFPTCPKNKPRNHMSSCLSAIWPINRCVITAFGFVSFRTVFFSPLVYQFAANLGIVCDVNLEGFARIKRTQARRWQSHLFATIVWPSMDRCWFRCFDRFWTKSVCLVAYEIVSDVYLEGQSKIRTVKYIAEGERASFRSPKRLPNTTENLNDFPRAFCFLININERQKVQKFTWQRRHLCPHCCPGL